MTDERVQWPKDDEGSKSAHDTEPTHTKVSTLPSAVLMRESRESSTSSLSSVPEDAFSNSPLHALTDKDALKSAVSDSHNPQPNEHVSSGLSFNYVFQIPKADRRTQNDIREELGLTKDQFESLSQRIADQMRENGSLGNIKFRQVSDLGTQSELAALRIALHGIGQEFLPDMTDGISEKQIDQCLWERAMYINSRWRPQPDGGDGSPEKRKRSKKGKEVKEESSKMAKLAALHNMDRELQEELLDNAEQRGIALSEGEDGQTRLALLENMANETQTSRARLADVENDVLETMSEEEQEAWFDRSHKYRGETMVDSEEDEIDEDGRRDKEEHE